MCPIFVVDATSVQYLLSRHHLVPRVDFMLNEGECCLKWAADSYSTVDSGRRQQHQPWPTSQHTPRAYFMFKYEFVSTHKLLEALAE